MTKQSVYDNGGYLGITRSYYTSSTSTTTPVYVGGQATGGTGTTSVVNISFSLSGGTDSTPQSGDIIVVVFASAGNDRDMVVQTQSSVAYTEIADLWSNDTEDTNLYVGYRISDGTDTGIRLPNGSFNTNDAYAVAIHVWRNIDQSTPLDVTSQTITQTNTSRPNPPQITTATDGAIVLAAGAGAHTGGVDTFTSSDLDNFETAGGNATNDITVGIGSHVQTTAGAFNPAAFGHTQADSTAFSAAAVTLALRPDTVTVYSNTYNSGIWNTQSVLEALSVNITYDYETVYGSPTYTITTIPSTAAIASGQVDDVLIAVDANIATTDDGILIELGGSGSGVAVGVLNGTLRATAFAGASWGASNAAQVEADITSYCGSAATYYVAIDASAFTIKVYVQPGGKGSTSAKILLGTGTSDGSGTTLYGTNQAGYGQIGGAQNADLEASYEVTFTGTIDEIRYWTESASYDFSDF